MTVENVKKRWGSEKYEPQKFKDGNYETKAKMAYSIMSDKSLIGKKYEEIRTLFGPNDGYYITETMPAYIVYQGDKSNTEVWQIVFRMSNKYKVNDIIMHKNCCER